MGGRGSRFPGAILISLLISLCVGSADGLPVGFGYSTSSSGYLSPANPYANADARRILNYLASLPNRSEARVLSGQFMGHGESGARNGYRDRVEALHQKTGKWVSLVGIDYGPPKGSSADYDLAIVNQPLIRYWNEGGLVTITWHAKNPWTGASAWQGVDEDFEPYEGYLIDAVTSGTQVNQAWMTELDHIADGLAELQDAGVVVLWRPFHEMNGGWFWWTARHPETKEHPPKQDFVNLWIHMFNHFTYERQLNNLLWVYAPSPEAMSWYKPVDYYYPGESYVDIVGLDVYSDSISNLSSYEKLIGLGKPFGFTEFGPWSIRDGSYDYMTLIRKIRSQYPEVTFWQSWGSWTDNLIAMVDHQSAAQLLNDSWVVTREGLDWENARLFEDVFPDHPYRVEIEILYQEGFTAGCSSDPLKYCPDDGMIRAESAVFAERGIHGTEYEPSDTSTPSFEDVPADYWGADWIESLWQDGYTVGCGTDPLIYCPLAEHTRAEGCVFYMRMLHGADYQPPEPAGLFADVPTDWWGAGWVEAAYQAELIGPCQTSPQILFCPHDPLSRGLAAHMMTQTKGLMVP